HEDIRKATERGAYAWTSVGADRRRDLEDFAAELEADAVLRVAAVDLIADVEGRIDVAAAALQEERRAAEILLDHLARQAGVVSGHDHRTAAHRHRVGRVAKDDRDRRTV